jgi:hypothetical protein
VQKVAIGDAEMLSSELIAELHKLTLVEKLRVVQLLVNELAIEQEADFEAGVQYSIYTPYGNEAAAQVLLEILNEEEAKDRKTGEAK